MAFVIQTPGTRETIPGLRERIASGLQTGIGEGFEQDALSKLTSQIQQGADPMQAILQSRLPAGRQRELISGFQKQQDIEQRGQLEAAKLQQQQLQQAQKFQQGEIERQQTRGFIEQASGGRINSEQLQGVPQATLNAIANNLTKPSEFLTPQQEAFRKIQEPILNKVATLEQNLSDTNRAVELATKGDVGIEFQKGRVVENVRSALRLVGVPVPLNADEAQLSNLVLRRADELKKKFGSRITNFDFEKWLEGQPAANKFRNANIALASMQRKEAEVDRSRFDAWREIVSTVPENQQLDAWFKAEREILQNADKELHDEIKSLSSFEKEVPVPETLEQRRDRSNREPKFDRDWET